MSQVVVDAATRVKLLQVHGLAEIRDEAGELLGEFIPKTVAEPLVPWDPSISQDELDRRAHTARGRPLSEVLRRLGIE
ncbi:MAG TPA: hypothetical protein VL371_22965 [Gemmataceae bacterium]|nr:hypothetical protein [Gemmataceae bacterium]